MIDTSEMNVVHIVFRREFWQLPKLVHAVPTGDTARAKIVGKHAELMLVWLAHHHRAEDKTLWPTLVHRVPADLVKLMEAQHQRAHQEIEAIGPTLARWRTTAAAADRDELARRMDNLHTVLIEHLDAEEQRMLPVAAETLTAQEWNHFRSVGRSGSLAKVPLIIGMLRYESDPHLFAAMLADVPRPVRAIMLRLATRAFRAFAVRVYGTTTPPRIFAVGNVG